MQQDLRLGLIRFLRWKRPSGQLTFPVYINAIQVMQQHKRDDVGDKSILVGWIDSIPENEIRSRFGGEAPAAQRQNLLEPRHCFEQIPLDLYMADIYGVARGDMAERHMNMRIRGHIHGNDLHVQAWAVQIVAFKVAYADGLSWSWSNNNVSSTVGNTAVLARSCRSGGACRRLRNGAKVLVDSALTVLVLHERRVSCRKAQARRWRDTYTTSIERTRIQAGKRNTRSRLGSSGLLRAAHGVGNRSWHRRCTRTQANVLIGLHI